LSRAPGAANPSWSSTRVLKRKAARSRPRGAS